jgi:hypothetical protein
VLDPKRAMFWDYLPDGLLKALRDLGGPWSVHHEHASHDFRIRGNRLLERALS